MWLGYKNFCSKSWVTLIQTHAVPDQVAAIPTTQLVVFLCIAAKTSVTPTFSLVYTHIIYFCSSTLSPGTINCPLANGLENVPWFKESAVPWLRVMLRHAVRVKVNYIIKRGQLTAPISRLIGDRTISLIWAATGCSVAGGGCGCGEARIPARPGISLG